MSTKDTDDVFIQDCWYAAAWDYELLDGKMVARTILEKPVVLYRGESGRIVALDDRCCHRAAPLSLGRVEGDDLRCMYHGMVFDPTGKCIQIPGQDMIPPKLGVRSYPVVEQGGMAWIWMGDPAKADPADVFHYEPLHDPKWMGIPGYIHYDANYLLIVDNLSDLAHLAFVHVGTLCDSEDYAYKTKPLSIDRLEDGFAQERWNMNSDSPPYHQKVIPNKYGKVDRRNVGRMWVPGLFVLETTFAPAGTGAEKGILVEGTRQYRNVQYMTPETRRTTHFFWNYLHDVPEDRYNIARSLNDSMLEAFFQDKAFIEGQQKYLDMDPEHKLLAIGADAALSHFRWLVGKRLAEQMAAKKAGAERAAA